MRFLKRFALMAALAAGPTGIAAAEDGAYTTRIEPRASYGATVTIEEGVRVFRPLPPDQHVIVNPGGRTPIGLGVYDGWGYYGPPVGQRR